MFLLIFILTSLFLTNLSCPSGSIQGLTPYDCYIFSNTLSSEIQKLGVDDAEGTCENLGGVLTNVASAFESNFIQNQAKNSFSDDSFYWIGGFQQIFVIYSNESIPWRWYDSFNFTYTNWAKDEPKNYGKNVGCYFFTNDSATEEQLIVAMKASLSDGTWYSTQSFDDLHYYVCKIPPTVSYCPEALGKSCETSSYLFKSNKFLKNIKHPFQKFNIPCACIVSLGNGMGNGTFNITTTNPCNAYSTNHSYLPSSFHSYEESMYYYYYSKYFYGYLIYCSGGSFANIRDFMGLRYDENIKNWTWIDGTVVDYLNWAPGYPKNPNLFGKCAYFDLISGVPNQLVNDFCYSNGNNNQAPFMWCYYIG